MKSFLKFLKDEQPPFPLTFILLKEEAFPDTSSIKTMVEYLYLKLDQPSTQQFQQLLMFWLSQEKGITHGTPKLMNEINLIISLQTNDPKYPYFKQIPAHINNR